MADDFGFVPDNDTNDYGFVADSPVSPAGFQQQHPYLGAIANLAAGGYATAVQPLTQVVHNIGMSVAPQLENKATIPSVEQLPFVNPQSMAFKAGEIAPYVAGGAGIAKALGGAAWKALTPVKQVSKVAGDYVGSLLGDTPLSAIPSKLAENIRNAEEIVAKTVKKKYADVENAAKEAGFSDNSDPANVLTNQLKQSLEKIGMKPLGYQGNTIKPAESLESLEEIVGHEKTPSEIKNYISKFMEAPSYKNAHNLQNLLGNRGADFLNIENPNVNKELGQMMNTAREKLVGDIKSSFEKAGHEDIANAYTEASDYFRDNHLPYRQIPFLKNAVNGIKTPKTLPSSMMSDQQGLPNVLDQLNQYAPESNKLIIANALSKKSGLKHDLNGDIVVNKVNELQNNINELKGLYTKGSENLVNNLSKIFTPGGDVNHAKNLTNILDAYEKAERVKGRIKKAAGLGLASSIPYHFTRGFLNRIE